jgi:hypothetical protein
MKVTHIIEKYLSDNEFDGLWYGDCGCFSGDLMPCGEYSGNCKPGYRKRLQGEPGSKMEIFAIVPDRPIPDGTWEYCSGCKKQWPHALDACPHCGNTIPY